ncbi:MAG: 5-(carboxyamino)imidazole ribonucleotide synthase [Flavobacteriales bacterium]
MEKPFYKGLKVGVLGGGQLGRMLLQKSYSYNLEMAFIDPDTHAPCREISNWFYRGDLNNAKLVYDFGKKCDVVTIEIENVSVEGLEQLEKEGIKVFPQPHAIKIVQDKGLQKLFYKENNFPTSEFYLIEGKADLELFKDQLPIVQKLRKGGYDGKGVQILRSESDFSKAFDGLCVLEKLVDIQQEISVIACRGQNGEVNAFPPVEMEFNPEANLVEFLFSPANISTEVEKAAMELAKKIITKLDMVGILAVEMFLSKDNELLVNEIAPRPHNSGHQTIEGNITSQYDQLLRCLIGMPLGSTDITIPSVMVNLLGEKDYMGYVKYKDIDKAMAIGGVNIHIYGKSETKSFRKMGHVTVVDKDLEKAKEKAKIIKDTLKVIA